MIEVKNLVKRYGNHLAVDHLSFQVDKGQIYGFLGPNGAGKSTTMNIMTGYLASTEGEVLINGMNILEEPEKVKKCIGYLPEQPPLYFDMIVEEYLKFAADLKKIERTKRKEQIEQVMEMTGIADVRERLIRNLSKGYRQRVGLAQAILGYPEILILDEPTVGLDPKQITEIRELIRSLSRKHTIILSSHILSEISAVCDYVMIINHGKLVASDTTENLEKMAMGSNTLDMTVKGKKNDVEKILESVEEIQSLEWDTKDRKKYESSEENTVSFSIKTDENIDIREKLFYKLAEAKLPILKMQATRISLEDVFLELTENEKEDISTKKKILEKQIKDDENNREEADHDSNL